MFPIRDTQPSFSLPFISIIIIGVCSYIFFTTLSLNETEILRFFNRFGVTPTLFFNRAWRTQTGFAEVPGSVFVTAMFLHGSFMHLIGNMWSLWIFGDNVEDKFGHFNFLLFYILTGVIASGVHIAMNPTSDIPSVGASGAIAGVMGAYLFMFPKATVLVMVPLLFWPLYFHVPSIVFIGMWFYSQVLSGFGSLSDVTQLKEGGVAWWAHVGGFVSGLMLCPFFIKRK